MTDDWNPNDPDATRVVYDLGEWTFDQQAELAADLAEAEVPHTWDGADLMVPESHEAQADGIIAAVETRLGVKYGEDATSRDDSDDDDDDDDDVDDDAVDIRDLPQPIDIPDGTPITEYELDEWPEGDRQALTHALINRKIPFRWEDDTIVVPTQWEFVADSLLDMIENGEFRSPDETTEEEEEADRLPFETLTTFFLAGERLQRNPLDADGLEQLLLAIELADPTRPPYGVDVRLWTRTCEIAEDLADALAEDADPDLDATMIIAQDLHDLLRPYI